MGKIHEAQAEPVPAGKRSGGAGFIRRTLRGALPLATLLALSAALAACGPCGDFLPSSLGETVCHSDHAPQ